MANRALTARLQQQDTGRLRVGRGAAELRIAVMNGEVVAATSADDLRHYLRRLLLAGSVSADRVQDLLAMNRMGAPVFGLLLDESDPSTINQLLLDRFVENLTRFLGSSAKPRFNHHPTIFADNFQLGHDPGRLVQSCADAWDDAMSIDVEMQLFSGSAPPQNTLQRMVLSRVGTGTTIARLLVQLPCEPFSARALLSRMLRARMLDTTFAPEADTQPTNGTPRPAFSDSSDSVELRRSTQAPERYVPDEYTPIEVDVVLGETLEDPPTDTVALTTMNDELDDPPTEEILSVNLLDEETDTLSPDEDHEAYEEEFELEVIDDPDEDKVMEIDLDTDDMLVAHTAPEPTDVPIELFDAPDRSPLPQVDDVFLDEHPLEDLILDEATEAPQDEETSATVQGAGDLSSLDAWINHGVEVDDDMEAFTDFDSSRGTSDEGTGGAFSTKEHNLDRVEVIATLEEPIVVEAAPAVRFGAPVLSEADAIAKVEVANSVLRTVSIALDAAHGHGRGQATLQLLVEGSPSADQTLFANLKTSDSGQLQVDALLRNLNHRPEGEHRRLLNQGLLNLIERTLSVAFEELEDEAIDSVLEDIAGYRQRMGL